MSNLYAPAGRAIVSSPAAQTAAPATPDKPHILSDGWDDATAAVRRVLSMGCHGMGSPVLNAEKGKEKKGICNNRYTGEEI